MIAPSPEHLFPPTPGRMVPPTPGRIVQESDDADVASSHGSMPGLVSAPPSMPGSENGDVTNDDDDADDAHFFMPPSAALDGVPLDTEELGSAAALDGGPLDAKKLRLDDGLGDAMDDGLGHLGDASGSLLIGMSGVAPAPTSSEIQCPDAADAGQPN